MLSSLGKPLQLLSNTCCKILGISSFLFGDKFSVLVELMQAVSNLPLCMRVLAVIFVGVKHFILNQQEI